MNNSDLYFKILTEEDPGMILRKLIEKNGMPFGLNCDPASLELVENILNTHYQSTLYESKSIKPTSIPNRIRKWLAQRDERKQRNPEKSGNRSVRIYTLAQ